jgi:NAD(P)-dependent dehydrogenase (short-subunit alcohol dehydrogenase family)
VTTSRRFEGRVAIITGAASGVGRATALRLASEGAAVVIADIRTEPAEETAAMAADLGVRSLALTVDVSEEASVAGAVAETMARFGRLDVIHNNAAALGPDVFGRDLDLEGLDVEIWDRTMAVNARGVMLGCKHAVPALRATGGGAIVNTASVSAFIGDDIRSSYGSSKAAIVAFTRYVATMYEQLSERVLKQKAAERVLPSPTQPEDIAAVVAFLASDDAACVTGQVLIADGGTLAHRPDHAMRAWEAVLREEGA